MALIKMQHSGKSFYQSFVQVYLRAQWRTGPLKAQVIVTDVNVESSQQPVTSGLLLY